VSRPGWKVASLVGALGALAPTATSAQTAPDRESPRTTTTVESSQGARGADDAPRASAPDARETPIRRVAVALPACEGPGVFDGQAVVRQLRTELVEDGIDRVETIANDDETPALARVSFSLSSCATDVTQVTVIVDDLATRKNVRRSVDLSDVRGALRTRALALAIAELLRASFSELALDDAPPPAVGVPAAVRDALRTRLRARVVDPTPSPPPVVATPRARRPEGPLSHRVGAVIDGRGASIGPVFVGGRGLYELIAARWDRATLSLRVDAGASLSALADPLGTVWMPYATVGVGALFEARAGGALDAGLGARVEGGAVWVLPRPTVEGVVASDSVHATFAVALLSTMRVRVTSRGWIGTELELGVAPAGPIVTAREGAVDRVIGGAAGAMAGARLGAGVRF
jgi:hypothetical protein